MRVILGGTNSGGKVFRSMKMFSFEIIIVSEILGVGSKFSRWGKNSLSGVKVQQVFGPTVTIQVFCSINHETFLFLGPNQFSE